MHVEEHEVGVFNKLFHSGSETSNGCAVQDTVIGRDAEVDGVDWLKLVSFGFAAVFDVFGNFVSLADCDDSGLGSQDCWHEVSATKVPHA